MFMLCAVALVPRILIGVGNALEISLNWYFESPPLYSSPY